ncbi:MAG: porin [Betaproteobacteria bacterium]|nr:porin [Betaproteobacteria bacterium]
MKSKLLTSLILAVLAMHGAAMAADAETMTMSEKPGAPAGGLPFDHAGHIDIGYTNLSESGRFATTPNNFNNRVFDFDRNAVNLHAIDLTLSKLPETGFGGLVNFTVGRDADTIAAYGTIDKNRGPANGVNQKFDVTQAYLHYATGPLMLIAGKYVTLAGAEVIKSPSDVNYSRSILFGYAIPFTHTGVRGTYKFSDTFSLTAGVNNGWDDFQDTNSDKTIEMGLSWAPVKSFALAAQGYTGKEQLSNYFCAPTAACVNPQKGTRNLIDLVATFSATEQLTLVLNYDYGSQGNATLVSGTTGTAKWEGWAGYANYQINDMWRLSLRGEWFNDKDGYRTVVGPLAAGGPLATTGQKWKEATLTLAYLPTKAIEIRAEVRNDWSDQKVFLATDGITQKDSQNSLGLEAIYKF